MVFFTEPESFHPRFEVAGCLLEHDANILILERQDHKPEGGTWGMPAGKLDVGESREAGMLREMEQETGYRATQENLRFLKKLYVRYPDYNFIYHLYHYSLDQRPTVTINPREHKSFTWVTPQEALGMNLIPGFDACLEVAYGKE